MLDAVLDSWDRSNRALLNLLGLIPIHGLDVRIKDGSPTFSEIFSHMHHERMVSNFENAPEYAGQVPAEEWAHERDATRIAERLEESRKRVRDAVAGRIKANRGLDHDFAHPIQLIEFLIFHDGYHHGQIKSALKTAGCPIADADTGLVIWDVWRAL